MTTPSTARRKVVWGAAMAAAAAMFTAGSKVQAKEKSQAWGDVDRLAALEDLRQLKHTYFASVDGKNWKNLRGVFTDDAFVDLGLPGPNGTKAPTTADGFVETISGMSGPGMTMKHHGHNYLINFTSPTEAEGSWDYEAWVWMAGADGKAPPPSMHTWGTYKEKYKKTPAGWRIASMTSVPTHTITEKA
jgi:hypothetical protein